MVLLLTATDSRAVCAQQRSAVGASIVGRVLDARLQQPIAAATVAVEGFAEIAARSDSAGRYRLASVPPGPQVIAVRRIGFAPARVAITVPASGILTQDITLADTPLRLQHVVVTADAAGRARGELGTASVIDREAIANQTAASIAGVLELLPGVPLVAPGLDNVQQIGLRSAPASSAGPIESGPSAAQLAAFGTLIVLDGVPLSNNANLQTAGPRAELPMSTAAGGGIDLRRIPAATIERVEVVRGIPSARYGDLTQGVILVDTRAGAVAPLFNVRADARTTEASVVGGRAFGATQAATAAFDIAHTRKAPGIRDDDAYRVAAQLAHRATLGKAASATSATGESGRLVLDTRADFYQLYEHNPEKPEVQPGRASSSRDYGFRIAERASLALANGARVELSMSIDQTRQHNFQQALRFRPGVPFTSRLTEGRAIGHYVGGQYLSRLTLDGGPRLFYTRLESQHPLRFAGFTHRFRMGTELRREKNSGAGYQFDIEFPPQTSFNGVQGFDRPRRFDAVPPVATTALYLDDRLVRALPGDMALDIQAGLRVDALHRGITWFSRTRDVVLQPRLNVELAPISWIRLRGGAGRTSKVPTIGSFAPPPQYYDVINVNYFANDPAERLAVLTTYVRDATNPNLGFSVANKAEAGIEVAPKVAGGGVLALVFYRDVTRGATGTREVPGFFQREHFDLVDSTKGTGRPPTFIEPASRVDSVPYLTSSPSNNLTLRNSGVEITALFPELRALRLRLEVQAAIVRTRLEKDDLDFGRTFSDLQLDADRQRAPYWLNATRTGARSIYTYRLIHHQPRIGLVVTGVVQHTLHESRQDIGGTDSLAFSGYITRTGTLVPVSAAQRTSPEFSDLRVPRIGIFTQPSSAPADWLFSLQLAKTIPLGGRLSFYAFNALDRTGRYSRSGSESRQYLPMRFGVEGTLPVTALFGGSARKDG